MNKENWKYLSIGDCATVVGGGTPSTKNPEYWDGDISWISPKDLSNNTNKYVSRGERFITKKGLENSSAKILPENSLLFSSRAPIGYLAINTQPMATNQGFKSLILKDEFDVEFFYYLFKQKTEYIKNFSSGSTFQEISGSEVKNLKFLIPPYKEQKQISKILSKLDKKIELNLKMNNTLEEITKTLFKSWFIDFDPVRAKVEGRPTGLSKEISNLFPDSFEDSELGEVPKGWEVKKVGECMEFNYGKALTAKNRVYGNIPVYGSNGIVGYHDTKKSNGPGIIVGRAGNPGTVHWSQKDYYVIDSAFSVNIFNNVSAEYFFYALKNLRLQRLNTGSAIPGLNRNHAYSENIVVPKLKLLEWFNQFSQNIFADQDCRLAENKNLSEIRDTLLPKLILGKIKVPDLDESLEKDS